MIFIAYNITLLITINNYINIQLSSILKYDTLTFYIKKYHYLIGRHSNCRHNKGYQFNLDRESVSQNWLADNQITIIDCIFDLEYYSYSHNLSPISFLKMHPYRNNYLICLP